MELINFGVSSGENISQVLEHGSDRHETLPKRVSDDPRQINFRRKKIFCCDFSVSEIIFGLFGLVLEALARNGPHHQLPRNFLL